MVIDTKKPNRMRSDYKEEQNRLIVFLMKMKGWEPMDVVEAFALEYGKIISRQSIRKSFNLYQKMYTKSSFKGYKPPKSL